MNKVDEIKQHLGEVIDPSIGKSLKETNGIKFVSIEEENEKVNLVIALEKVDDPTKQAVTRSIAKVIKLDLKYKGLKIDFQLRKLESSILSKDKKVKYIGIASGKGGVGKSTVAANLALALSRLGKKVGIIDADIYGCSIPNIFDMKIQLPKADENEKIIPFKEKGLEIISTEFFMQDGKPLMWRGPMLGKMLNHFFYDVGWDENLDYLIIDLPPGTGDVAMDIQKLIPECKMLIVTTPHQSASHVAVKAGWAAKEMKHQLLGVVENMSYFKHNGEKLNIFGENGGKVVAEKLETDLIAQIPIGHPESGHHSLFEMHEEIGVHYLGLANKMIKEV
ncbi:P-loop NTPase [Liberiplasma polymorphum]|uniref:P-loop NTPase n=1 Tax=Liberiplasma polymorphum TaxID=3374570 RepID=UPI003774C366